MARSPCCDKAAVKRGPWSAEEDARLRSHVERHGVGGWTALPRRAGLRRCGKSCRLRWLNYLRPGVRHGGFSPEEDRVICALYAAVGSRWSLIAAHLPGRTDNGVKNYWNTRLKKKLLLILGAPPPLPTTTPRCYWAGTGQAGTVAVASSQPAADTSKNWCDEPAAAATELDEIFGLSMVPVVVGTTNGGEQQHSGLSHQVPTEVEAGWYQYHCQRGESVQQQ